jgi:radical SAM protein with 4Fe4S-binding SPASM domain
MFELYDIKKITNQIKTFPKKIKKVYMQGTGESTLNKDLPQMIQYLKDQNVVESIGLITNGVFLTKQLGQSLIRAGLSHIHISVEALSSVDYKKITGSDIDFDKFISNIKTFFDLKGDCRLTIKIADISVPTEQDKALFHDIFSGICDEIFIEHIYPIWPIFGNGKGKNNEQESTIGQYGQPIQEKAVCPQIFTTLAIKCDGSVSPCSVDWNNKNVLGNIHNETLQSIWEGELLQKLRLRHLSEGRHTASPCDQCGLPKYGCIDNIDNYKEAVIKRLTK